MKTGRQNAWTGTLALIECLSSSREARATPCALASGVPRTAKHDGWHMKFVERLSPTHITLNWRDATSGCYGEQIWHLTTARTRSSCMMCGAPIRRGNAVYRPRLRGRRPANADWVVLASTIERIESDMTSSLFSQPI